MPQMAGIDAVRAIRARGDKTPIVMVTTEAEKHRVLEAIQAGINDYLVKPFGPEQLAAKVKKFAPLAGGAFAADSATPAMPSGPVDAVG